MRINIFFYLTSDECMARKLQTHAYAEQSAFERLLCLIATFVHYPGIGSPDWIGERDTEGHHQALAAVQVGLQQVAQKHGVELSRYAIPTLRKDLETLRRYGVLDRRMYRWGYYLGTGGLRLEELQIALQALVAQAEAQGDPRVRRVYEEVSRRFRGLNLELKGQLFYPVRSQLSRVIVPTDPEEMMRKGQYRRTLFHHLTLLEVAIIQGQAIELCRVKSPYSLDHMGYLQVWPLQLLYSDGAWYLLYEHCDTRHLAIGRLDRFSDHWRSLATEPRGTAVQWERLQVAHDLLSVGWGLFLGTQDQQVLERQGVLPLIAVTVRFFPPVTAFILEGEQRHPRQTIRKGKGVLGELTHVDYTVELPERSLDEFGRWVNRFMQYAQVLSPAGLAERHKNAAQELLARYC